MDREELHAGRLAALREAMRTSGVEAVLLSVGADLPWLVGYEAMPLERLTMLVVPAQDEAVLVVPRLEAPRVVEEPSVFRLLAWEEGDDPLDLVVDLVGAARRLAVGNRTWSQFVVGLLSRVPDATLGDASAVVGPLRARKDAHEVAALQEAAAAVDRIAGELQAGDIPLVGRTEAEVSAEIGRRILAEGHHKVNFAIVAAGPDAASPHHDPGGRKIAIGEVVLCDFGGAMRTDDGASYCSDITRCVHTGPVPPELADLYAVLRAAQRAGVQASEVGTSCDEVDEATRRVIIDGGYGDRILHRTGHGIGVEEHEEPYVVLGNRHRIEPGNAFSIEPGIYVPGRWGARLEDIVVARADGPLQLNTADHDLVVVEA